MNKVVFVLAAVLASAFSVNTRGKLYILHDECQSDPATKLAEDYIEDGHPTGSPIFGLHTLCIFVKGGIMNENGDINVENLREVLSSHPNNNAAAVDNIVKKCGKKVGTTAVDAGIALNNCFSNYDKRSWTW
ncbi:hypothetical protein JTB14_032801 [Gonioctena quinquepunctata]|nr:hypothetical protein JTB14_032801 [Gonioctena quinquepunctata]